MPSVPPAIITPAVSDLLYFASSIGFVKSSPMDTTDAPTIPVVAAKSIAMSVAATAIPPRCRPRATDRLSNSLPATPDWLSSCPIRTNSGTARRL